MWRQWITAAAALIVGHGCIPVGSFACASDSECGAEGWCEMNGHCAVTDSECDSNRRYGQYAPSGIAGRCVEPLSQTTGSQTGTGQLSATGPGPSGSGTDTAGESDTLSLETGSESTGDPGIVSPCLAPGRVPNEPVLLYDFCEGKGERVSSLTGTSLDLLFEAGTVGDGFEWTDEGLLVASDATVGATALRGEELVFERLDPCRDSGEVSLEVWATPAYESQGGPTGIAMLGPGTGGSGTFDIAIRMNPDWAVAGYVAELATTDTALALDWTGTPFLRPNHLVLVHGDGATTLYLDGEVLASEPHAGDLSGWNPNYDLVLGNSSNYDVRNWAGTYHLVAIYCEALSAEQVGTNFAAGHRPE